MLSRLLTPEDFGIVAIATVVIAFFNILGDIGIGPAIIQNKNLTEEDINQIYSLTIYVGIILSIIFIILAYPIAKFYSDSNLIGICQWLSFTIFFTCINIVPLNLRYKHKDFKQIAYVTLSVQIISGVISILYAYKGGGVYALVLSSILSSFMLALIYNYLASLRFRFILRRESLQKIMSFSIFQFLFNIIAYFSRNIDKLLIGKYIGLTQLGYYEKSYRLMMLPLQNITFVITPVMLPIFSDYQSDVKILGQNYIKLIRLLSYISFPLSIILFFCSRELVLLIFGSQWIPSIQPFKILSFTVALQILTSSTGSIYQAVGATKKLFYTGCWGALFLIGSFAATIFYWHNLEAVCIGYLLAQLMNTIQCFWMLFNILDIPIKKVFCLFTRPLFISIILLAGYYCFSLIPLETVLFFQLIIKMIFGISFTLILIQFLSPYDIVQMMKNKTFNL